MQLSDVETLLKAIAPGCDPADARLSSLGGGPQVRWKLQTPRRDYFLKTAADRDMLRAETEGLELLAATQTLRVPVNYGVHEVGTSAVLCLEYLELVPLRQDAEQRLGRELAALHRFTDATHGLDRDNYIGLGRQSNVRSHSWSEFFVEQRLRPQLEALAGNGSPGWMDSARELLAKVPRLLEGHEPEASLLHGDLWSGNAAMTREGEPVVFDPAVHFGDRECDIAMTRMFGGFSGTFHSAYEAAWPLPEGWRKRQLLYQLYHLLNHAKLFGGSYLAASETAIRNLIS